MYARVCALRKTFLGLSSLSSFAIYGNHVFKQTKNKTSKKMQTTTTKRSVLQLIFWLRKYGKGEKTSKNKKWS